MGAGLFAAIAALAVHAGAAEIPVGPGESIQAAIDMAEPGDEIVLAPGTYAGAVDFLGKPLVVRSSGGALVTTIDGGGAVDAVVRFTTAETGASRLEGVTVTGGGSGLLVSGASPTIVACRLVGNDAGFGGGARCLAGAAPRFEACVFLENQAGLGGGLYASASMPTVLDAAFTDNVASTGAGVYLTNGSGGAVRDSTFVGNAGSGGGMALDASDPIVAGCTFRANIGLDGGGLSVTGGAAPIVASCSFIGNAASNDGGGVNVTGGSTPTIAGCVFSGNTARFGAGLAAGNNGAPAVSNCTMTGNVAELAGGGLYNAVATGTTTVANTIIWGNAPDAIVEPFGVGLFVATSIVEGGWVAGNDVLDVDPLLIDPLGADGAAGTADDDVGLAAGSPAIDRGFNAAVALDAADLDGDDDLAEPMPLDRAGGPRFVDVPATPDGGIGTPPFVDLGAFEAPASPPPPLCPTDVDGSGSTDFADLLGILGRWGPCAACDEDVDASGAVDFVDLLAVLNAWGPC